MSVNAKVLMCTAALCVAGVRAEGDNWEDNFKTTANSESTPEGTTEPGGDEDGFNALWLLLLLIPVLVLIGVGAYCMTQRKNKGHPVASRNNGNGAPVATHGNGNGGILPVPEAAPTAAGQDMEDL